MSVRILIPVVALTVALAVPVFVQSSASVRGRARAGPVEEKTNKAVIVTVRGQEAPATVVRSPDRPSVISEDAAVSAKDLFIRAVATADQAYQNEQVVVEYHLFYRPGVRLRHSHLADAWDAPGFWREELDVPSRPIPRTRRVDGQIYKTIVLKRVALFPTHPGILRIDPLRVEAEAQRTIKMQGAAVRGRFKPVQLASEPVTLSVRPLPPAAPSPFDGAVGRFSMTVRMETDSVKVGDVVQLTVQVQGSGNLATLSPPPLNAPSEFEVYDPAIRTDIDRSGERIEGTKTFTYTLVPRSSGKYTLPPVVFSYFDPEGERYRTLRSDPLTLHVAGEAPPRAVGRTGSGLPVGTITELAEAGEARWVRADRRPLYRQLWVYVALLLPVVAAGGGVAYRHWERELETGSITNPVSGRDPVQEHLRRAREHHQEGTDLAFYDALEQALRAFLDERLRLNGISASQTAIDRRLAHHEVPKTLRESLYDVLDRCREAQFDPNQEPPESAEAVLNETQTLLRRLDEALPDATNTNSQL